MTGSRKPEAATSPVPDPSAVTLASLGEVLAAVRARRPLVHQMAGPVTLAYTADALLAFGGAPVMAVAPQEVAELAAQASALVLNLGMPESERLAAMLLAGEAAREAGVPIVLDPVGVGGTAFRSAAARDLLARLPVAVIRGNAGEVWHLAYGGRGVRGVDAATDGTPPDNPAEAGTEVTPPESVANAAADVSALGSGAAGAADATARESAAAAAAFALPPAAAAATQVARRHGAVVAATGPLDVVATGSRLALVAHGTPLLARISGTGCMASVLVGCCLGVGADPLLAAVTALVALGQAAERAAARAAGPGSFRSALFDCLAALTPQELARDGRVRWLSAGVGWP